MAVESLKTLRRRVRTVKNIRQITRAMEMVSAAKLRRAQSILIAGRPYAARLQELLAHMAESANAGEHPLFKPRVGNRKILILFTADRGLCGSFNANLIKETEGLLASEPQTQWELICIGKKGNDYFRSRRWPIIEAVTDLRGNVDAARVREMADRIVERFGQNQCDSVWLLYSAFISTVASRPTLVQYLPLTPEAFARPKSGHAEEGRAVDYICEPSAQEVFDALVPRYLFSRIYITAAEVATSEHSARMVAMNNATKNCQELGDMLTLKLNKLRQEAITRDLLDIVGGAEALRQS